MAKRRFHPWRDNLEAVTMALVVAVLFKYFILEAYKIPTGSMQPTLFGWQDEEGGGVYDRILVDKASYHWRDPERFEVAVFRYPLDRSKHFIKRVWGLPGDRIRIQYGDVWSRSSDAEPWTILRRPPSVLTSTWLEVPDDGRWGFGPGSWRTEGGDLVAEGAGKASFPEGQRSVRDRYTDGYPPKLAERIRSQRELPGNSHNVGDLRVRTHVNADEDCAEVRLHLHEGTLRYTAVLPGPAAPEGTPYVLRRTDTNGRLTPLEVTGEGPRLAAGAPIQVVLENLDDELTLEVGDRELHLGTEPTRDQRSRVELETTGGGARFGKVSIWRDIYYTSTGTHQTYEVPEGHYFMLGDNTLDSRDSRGWQLRGYGVDGEVLRGSGYDGDEKNPRAHEGQYFFRDEYGERHVFAIAEGKPQPPIATPFVPRHMIAGRALLVFWPYVPSLDVYRLAWIR